VAENDPISQTKEAFILSRQLEALEKAMSEEGAVAGCLSFFVSYNKMLFRARTALKSDKNFTNAIELLPNHTARGAETLTDFYALKSHVAILRATVFAFFEFYSPKEEKAQIGFSSQHAPVKPSL
jgi:hypothetical protein